MATHQEEGPHQDSNKAVTLHSLRFPASRSRRNKHLLSEVCSLLLSGDRHGQSQLRHVLGDTGRSRRRMRVETLSRARRSVARGPQPTRLLRLWDFPGKNTGMVPSPSPGDLPSPGKASEEYTGILFTGPFQLFCESNIIPK